MLARIRRPQGRGADILDTVAEVMPHARRLGCAEGVMELSSGVRQGQSDADWLRARRGATGSLAGMVCEACALWAGTWSSG